MKEIFSRRSVRKYTDEPVSAADTEKLLRAAMQAPSACNEQPWDFIIFSDKDTVAKINAVQPYTTMLQTAPLCIAVCGDTAKEIAPGYWVQDCSAAMENMLLEAEHLGLGGVWMGFHPIKERTDALSEIFGLPETVTVLGLCAIGHPAVKAEPVDRFNPDRIHHEKW